MPAAFAFVNNHMVPPDGQNAEAERPAFGVLLNGLQFEGLPPPCASHGDYIK
jgi:hypothetical protein